MRFLSVMAIVVWVGASSGYGSSAGNIDLAILKRITAAVEVAKPLLSAKRLRRLLTLNTAVSNDEKLMVEDARGLDLAAFSRDPTLPPTPERSLPDYMIDVSGLHYDIEKYQLHLAVAWGHYQMVEALLQLKDVDINTPDMTGRTLLHIAAELGDTDMVALLIRSGAKLNAKVKRAWRYQDNDTGRKKQRKSKLDNKETRGMTAAHLAINGRHLDTVALLLLEGAAFDIANHQDATPVHIAATLDFVEALYMLKLADVDIDIAIKGVTPLDMALMTNATQAIDFLTLFGGVQAHDRWLLQVQYLDQLKLLTERGARFVSGVDTAVIEHARHGRAELVSHVIDVLGGNPNAKDERGVHALRHALRSGDAATITALLERGADPHASKKKKRKTHLAKAEELGLAHLFAPWLKLPKDAEQIADKDATPATQATEPPE